MTSLRSAPFPHPAPCYRKLPALICLGDCENPDEEGYGTRPASPDIRMIVDFSGYDPEEWDAADVSTLDFPQALLDSQGGEEDLEEVALHWMDIQGGPSDGTPEIFWIEVVLVHLTDQPDPFDLIAADTEDDDSDEQPSNLEELWYLMTILDEASVHFDRAARAKAATEGWDDAPLKKRWYENPVPPFLRTYHRRGLKSAASGRGRSQAVRDAREAERLLQNLERARLTARQQNEDETASE